MKSHIPLILAAAAFAGAALAAETEPVRQEVEAAPEGSVAIRTVAGRIDVKAGEGRKLLITGTIEKGAVLKIDGSPSERRIVVEQPEEDDDETLKAELVIQVPAGTTLDVETVSADIGVDGTRGNIRAASVSGDVRLTVGSAEVEASSVSGDVRVQAPAVITELESVSGDLHARGLKRVVDAESVSGAVDVEIVDAKSVDIESVSGDIRVNAELAAGADVDIESLSGDTTLVLPGSPSARLDAHTFSGKIVSDFPSPTRKHAGRLAQTLGEGSGGEIRLESFSGDIEVRKK